MTGTMRVFGIEIQGNVLVISVVALLVGATTGYVFGSSEAKLGIPGIPRGQVGTGEEEALAHGRPVAPQTGVVPHAAILDPQPGPVTWKMTVRIDLDLPAGSYAVVGVYSDGSKLDYPSKVLATSGEHSVPVMYGLPDGVGDYEVRVFFTNVEGAALVTHYLETKMGKCGEGLALKSNDDFVLLASTPVYRNEIVNEPPAPDQPSGCGL